MRIRFIQNFKNRRTVGGGGICPQTPALFLPPAISTLSNTFLAVKYFLLKKNKITTVNALLLFLTFAPIFYLKLCIFVGGGARIFLDPRRMQAAGYPSYATETNLKYDFFLEFFEHL